MSFPSNDQMEECKDDLATEPRICFWISEEILKMVWPSTAEAGSDQATDPQSTSTLAMLGETTVKMSEAKAVAASGAVLIGSQEINSYSAFDKHNRVIYDMQFCKRQDDFPGCLMRSEGEAPIDRLGDSNVNMCYDHLGIALDFASKELKYPAQSDRAIAPIVGIVNYDFYFPNAWWGPVAFDDKQRPSAHGIVFGNGFDHDPFNGNAPTRCFAGQVGKLVTSLQCVAHEVFHGITFAMQPGLEGSGEPGAVGEHISDVFGMLVEQWHKEESTDESNWLIGEEVVLPAYKGMALKSMAKPGTAFSFGDIARDTQVGHMKQYYTGNDDQGGIHINSGILNRGFYELAKQMGGNAWERPGQIWWAALKRRLPSNCSFRKWATVIKEEAVKLYGEETGDQVRGAWECVGIKL